jgi:integrase
MEPIDIKPLIRRRPRKQTGQYRETDAAFFIRFYRAGRRVEIKVADKSAQYQTRADVEHLITKLLAGDSSPNVSTIAGFVETKYLRFVEANRAAATAHGYRKIWEQVWKPAVGHKILATLPTVDVSTVLTALAERGRGSSAISHAKWFLSGVFEHAIATGVVQHNPCPHAQALCKVPRKKRQHEYSLHDMVKMLTVLELMDLRAAVAVALAYYAGLRPSEVRGLQWSDYDESAQTLQVRRSVWHNVVGDTKNISSARTVPYVLKPLRDLLEKMRALTGGQGYILPNEHHQPLDLDNLNQRVIAPALKRAGLEWHGYYACRRGISSQTTNSSGNVLNATRLLGHTTPITTLAHYTQAQVEQVKAALQAIEELALVTKDQVTNDTLK